MCLFEKQNDTVRGGSGVRQRDGVCIWFPVATTSQIWARLKPEPGALSHGRGSPVGGPTGTQKRDARNTKGGLIHYTTILSPKFSTPTERVLPQVYMTESISPTK